MQPRAVSAGDRLLVPAHKSNGPESRSVFSRGHNDSYIAPIIRLLGQPPADAPRGGRRSGFGNDREPPKCQPCVSSLSSRAKHVSEVGDALRFGTVFELAAPGVSISPWAGTARSEPLAVLLHSRYSSSPTRCTKTVAPGSRLREALGCAARDTRSRRTFGVSHTELVLLRTPIPPLFGGADVSPEEASAEDVGAFLQSVLLFVGRR